MKKFLSILLAFILVFSFCGTAFASDFVDVEKHANKEAIEVISALEIMNGYSKTEFGVDDNLTRAQACAIITRTFADIYGVKVKQDYVNNFSDVSANHYFKAEIDTAYRMGFMSGYEDGTFRPDEKVTYAQMTTILLNAIGYSTKHLSGTWPENALVLANTLGLMKDTVWNTYCTRATAAQMIYNSFSIDMVRYNGYTYVSTGDTVLEAMDYDQYTETGKYGHKYIVFEKDGESFETTMTTTYEVAATYINGTKVETVDGDKVDFKNADRYYNGKKCKYFDAEYNTAIEEDDKVTLIFDEDDDLISILVWKNNTYTPLNIENYDGDVDDIKHYRKGISTITVSGEDEDDIHLSNNYAFGYIVDVSVKSKYTKVELSDGTTYKIDIANDDINEDEYIIIYFDYLGDCAGYLVF